MSQGQQQGVGWKYVDDWVETRVLYQFLGNGGCACCGLAVRMSLADMIAQCTDLSSADGFDDDDAPSPWPAYMKQQVWVDRIKFRKLLKAKSREYGEFWRRCAGSFTRFWEGDHDSTCNDNVPSDFPIKPLSLDEKRRLCCVTVQDIHRFITGAGFDLPYQVLLQTITEQLLHFELTKYGIEGGSPTENHFQAALLAASDQFQAFSLTSDYLTATFPADPAAFIGRLIETGGPKLLVRTQWSHHTAPAKQLDTKEDASATATATATTATVFVSSTATTVTPSSATSHSAAPRLPVSMLPRNRGVSVAPTRPRRTHRFKSDRRLVRIVIFRLMLDRVIAEFARQTHRTE